jgi:hypothetical protein
MTHLSSLIIDSLAAGKLDAAEVETARAHIATCARCRGDLDAAEAAVAHFERSVLPRTIGAIQRPRRRWWWIVPSVLAPALATLALVWWFRRPAAPIDDDTLRIKGGLTFQVFANRHGEVIPVRDGTHLDAGDSIRFVVGTGAPYIMVVSIDGAGHPSIYYPYEGERSGTATSEPSELPGSIVLDATNGPERVFALASATPLDAQVVTRALETIGARGPAAIRETQTVDVPTVHQASVVFEKGPP